MLPGLGALLSEPEAYSTRSPGKTSRSSLMRLGQDRYGPRVSIPRPVGISDTSRQQTTQCWIGLPAGMLSRTEGEGEYQTKGGNKSEGLHGCGIDSKLRAVSSMVADCGVTSQLGRAEQDGDARYEGGKNPGGGGAATGRGDVRGRRKEDGEVWSCRCINRKPWGECAPHWPGAQASTASWPIEGDFETHHPFWAPPGHLREEQKRSEHPRRRGRGRNLQVEIYLGYIEIGSS